jgi:hypothetical protein
MSRMVPAAWVRGVAAAVLAVPPVSAAPLPLTSPQHQAPVRAAPGGLLYLPGDGLHADDVVRLLRDDGSTAPVPVQVVEAGGVPYGLTLRLPEDLAPRFPFVLQVAHGGDGAAANLRVNDARPSWFSPAFVLASRPFPGLPRRLRIVGRNLDRLPGAALRVRLAGPVTVDLPAMATRDPVVAEHVVDVALPGRLVPGQYRVSLQRDAHWVTVTGQVLEVRPDPAPDRTFAVGDGCLPDDALDDTACLLRAIARASTSGGGTVVLGPGTWRLGNPRAPGVAAGDGIVLPVGVSLVGAGRDETRIEIGLDWSRDEPRALLTLPGANLVSGIGFADMRPASPRGEVQLALLQLGRVFYRAGPAGKRPAVEDVAIVGNRIDGPWIGIGDGGLPLRRLVVVDNDIAAQAVGLAPAGNRYNVEDRFELSDSVISGNRFHPGRYADLVARQGTMAATFGASRRVVFTDNLADGRSRRLLGPDDGSGWRAAFFWNLAAPQEQLLVAGNQVFCPGDRLGDGEAIAFDNSGNGLPYAGTPPVVAAGPGFVELGALPRARQNDRDLAGVEYYAGYWATIGEGAGLGQSRRIVGASSDGSRSRLRLQVEPDWDVLPVPGSSRVTVARQFWQVFVLDNEIDQRTPACRKSNATDPKGGAIALWGQMSDSVVAGNRQYDTDGILLQQAVAIAPEQCASCDSYVSQLMAIDIRANLVEGEYARADACSRSGIQAWVAAGRDGRPVFAGSGINIESNRIRDADGRLGAAVAMDLGGWQGPMPQDWPLVRGLTIQLNEIESPLRPRSAPGRCGPLPAGPAGITLKAGRLLRGPVLHRNRETDQAGAKK